MTDWTPHDMLSSKYAADARTRWVQAAHHDVAVEMARVERLFRCHDMTREAEQVRALCAVVKQNAVAHCERLLANGHSQPPPPTEDSAPVSESTGSPVIDSHRVCAGMAGEQPTSDVVQIPFEVVIQRRIAEVMELPESQAAEVSMKFLRRAQTMWESGVDDKGRLMPSTRRHELAMRLLIASANVLDGGLEDVG